MLKSFLICLWTTGSVFTYQLNNPCIFSWCNAKLLALIVGHFAWVCIFQFLFNDNENNFCHKANAFCCCCFGWCCAYCQLLICFCCFPSKISHFYNNLRFWKGSFFFSWLVLIKHNSLSNNPKFVSVVLCFAWIQ